jgi:MFS family permease
MSVLCGVDSTRIGCIVATETALPESEVNEPGVAAPRKRFAALHSRNFRILWAGLIFSNVGGQVQMIAESWLILQITNSPLALGIMSLCFGVPMIVLPMLGGAVADRFDRITVLKFTQSEEVIVPLILAAIIGSGHLHVWMLYVGAVLGGSMLAFDNPARSALLPGLVPPEDLMNAMALMSAVWTGALLIGPALGGVLLGTLGAAWLFAINGLTTIGALVAIYSLRDVRNRKESGAEAALQRLIGGVRYAMANRGVFALLGLTLATGLLGRSYSTLLPVFARDLWHTGPRGYGLLLMAPGAGALIGAFGVAALGDIKAKGRFVIIANAIYCGSLLLFSLLPPFAAGMGLLVLAGLASTAFGAAIGTMLQFATPGPLRGRVMSLYTIAVIGGPSLGGLLGGALAQVTNAQLTVALGVILLAVATLGFARPVAKPLPEAI